MQSDSSGRRLIRFGTFELDVRAGELRKQGIKIRIQEQPLRILEILLAHSGQLVTREELSSQLWPFGNLIDFDHSLNKAVNKLREALDDSAESPRFIETIPRRGYRMISPLRTDPTVRSSVCATTSVAVARFAALEHDPQAIRATADLTRNLVARLGQMRGYTGQMRVVAFDGNSAIDVTDLGNFGRQLDAGYVVSGDVSSDAQGYAVDLQLIDATSGVQIWSCQDTLQISDLTFERSGKFGSLARRVRAVIVNAEMQRVLAHSISDLSAEELVLRALATWKREATLSSAREARQLANKALELDPDLVSALLTRVRMLDQEYGLDASADRRRIANEIDQDTARAVKLDPANETAWAWRAIAQVLVGRWDAAPTALERAIELDPQNPLLLGYRAIILNRTGHPDEGLVVLNRIRTGMDPSDAAQLALFEGYTYLLLGQPESAATICEKAAVFARVWNVQVLLVAAYASQGDWTKTNAAKAELLRLVPGFTIAQARGYDEPSHPEYAKLAEKYIYEGLRKAGIPED